MSESYLDVPDTQQYLDPGCTRLVAEFYGHVWGRNRVAWLQIIRAFCVMFLWTGFLKNLVVCRNYVFASRRGGVSRK